MVDCLIIRMRTANAAFQEDGGERYEIARILRELADDIEYCDGVKDRSLLDYNGNVIGSVEIN